MKGLLFDGGNPNFWLLPRSRSSSSGAPAQAGVPASQRGVMEKRTCQNSEISFFRRLQVWLMEIIVLTRCREGSERHRHTSWQLVQEGRMMPKSA